MKNLLSRKVLGAVVLVASMASISTVTLAGAVSECAAYPIESLDNTFTHLDNAYDLLEKRSYRARLKGRAELRSALFDITTAEAQLLGCGLLDQQIDLFDFPIVLEEFKLELIDGGGNFTREVITIAANALIVHALKESRGFFDVDALNDIEKAMALIELVISELDEL